MNPLVSLAKLAVESYVKNKEIIKPPDNFPEEFLAKKSGVFVTIEKIIQQSRYKDGELEGSFRGLRGCIGTYLPSRKNIAEEVIYNAIAAATQDYRFGPIQKEELPCLFYTVYILTEPELVRDLKELNPHRYGIIVKTTPIAHTNNANVAFNGRFVAKTGLLLPDLEGIDTVEKQIFIAAQKAGIDLQKEKILIYRFAVEKFSN